MYSIGHSNHNWETFSELLQSNQVTAIADVRTVPTSKYSPHFKKYELKSRLSAIGISYAFLGKELGGRPGSYEYFSGAKADYEKMATAPDYLNGIERLIRGSRTFRIAMVCSEHDPLDCHRCLLVSRTLLEREIDTKHVLQSGDIQTQSDIERTLLSLSNRTSFDMFQNTADSLSLAYRERSLKIAYSSDGAI